MRERILERLKQLETEHGVWVLYACESGSRAWGFASPDSDFDVRFIYARPVEWYLTIDVEHRRDVIECPIIDALDIAGWDIRKALKLLSRTNGALLEWLHSPIVYRDQGAFRERLQQLAATAVDARGLCYHYAHMARGNAGEFLDGEEVRLKKYFYVLRPLLAIRHIESTGCLPPVEFQKLVESFAPEALRPEIDALLERKRRTEELGVGPPMPLIDAFIREELARHEAGFHGVGRPDIEARPAVLEELNRLFRDVLSGEA